MSFFLLLFFNKNVFGSEDEYQKYLLSPVKRTIDNRVSELHNLNKLILFENIEYDNFYDIAYVSDFDKIIPPINQMNCHNFYKVRVKNLSCGHFPFYEFGGLDYFTK